MNNQKGVTPPRDEVLKQPDCAHQVMAAYYPQALDCEKQLFIAQGWQGCFAAENTGVSSQ